VRLPAHTANRETLAAAAILLALSALFAAWLWFQRRGRDEPGSEEDVRYLAGHDRRRFLVAVILAAIGLAMMASTAINPRSGPSAARLWGWTWVGVLALAVSLLVLALVDWVATRAYARIRRLELIEEHRDLLAQALGRGRPAPQEGRRRPPSDENGGV
jgi:uncharacterized membrane protein YbhN (UPF0104 family)